MYNSIFAKGNDQIVSYVCLQVTLTHLMPDVLVNGQTGGGGHKPTVAQSSLFDITRTSSLNKKLGVLTYLL